MMRRLLVTLTAFLAAMTLWASPADAYFSAGNVYWGTASSTCANCYINVSVQAWPTNDVAGRSYPGVLSLVQTDSYVSGSWYQQGSSGSSGNGYFYADAGARMNTTSSGTTTWRITFDVAGG